MKVGILHPGEMGTAVASVLIGAGHKVLWVSEQRSPATAERAKSAGLEDSGSHQELAERCEVILSICPPAVAADVARRVPAFSGLYVDANAISPATSRVIAAGMDRFVDGSIIGPPPTKSGTTRLFLSGAEADVIAELFAATIVQPVVVSNTPGAASAVKMVFSAWTKGTAALALSVRALARAENVEDAVLSEWARSQPDLAERCESAARSAQRYGWRWQDEMEEIASTFAAAGLPDGYHRAAAEIYRRSPREPADGDALNRVMSAIRRELKADELPR